MNNLFNCRIVKSSKHTCARVTEMTTSHGTVLTPAFMPVGTRAFVNHMTPKDLLEAGSQIILGVIPIICYSIQAWRLSARVEGCIV